MTWLRICKNVRPHTVSMPRRSLRRSKIRKLTPRSTGFAIPKGKLLSRIAVKLDEESIPGWFTVAYTLSPTTFSVQGWVEGMLVTDDSGWTAGDPLLWMFLLWRHSITTDSITGKAAAMHYFTRACVCLTSLACCFSSLRTGRH